MSLMPLFFSLFYGANATVIDFFPTDKQYVYDVWINWFNTIVLQTDEGFAAQIGPETKWPCKESDVYGLGTASIGMLYLPGGPSSEEIRVKATMKNFRRLGLSGYPDVGTVTVGDYYGGDWGAEFIEKYTGPTATFQNLQSEPRTWQEEIVLGLNTTTDTGGILIKMNASPCENSAFEVSIDRGYCPLSEITEIVDPEALQFEAGNRRNRINMQPAMRTALSCLENSVSAEGGTFNFTSGYRPTAYQQHLLEIWDLHEEAEQYRDNPACDERIQAIDTEFDRHGLVRRPAARRSRHEDGLAFDGSWTPASLDIDALADGCGLKRPLANDRVHFELK